MRVLSLAWVGTRTTVQGDEMRSGMHLRAPDGFVTSWPSIDQRKRASHVDAIDLKVLYLRQATRVSLFDDESSAWPTPGRAPPRFVRRT